MFKFLNDLYLLDGLIDLVDTWIAIREWSKVLFGTFLFFSLS